MSERPARPGGYQPRGGVAAMMDHLRPGVVNARLAAASQVIEHGYEGLIGRDDASPYRADRTLSCSL